jgi:hypothetical protein
MSAIFICPVCGAECDFYHMPEHMEVMSDDKHLSLFHDLDLKRNDAYMETECQWVIDNCKEKPTRRKKRCIPMKKD